MEWVLKAPIKLFVKVKSDTTINTTIFKYLMPMLSRPEHKKINPCDMIYSILITNACCTEIAKIWQILCKIQITVSIKTIVYIILLRFYVTHIQSEILGQEEWHRYWREGVRRVSNCSSSRVPWILDDVPAGVVCSTLFAGPPGTTRANFDTGWPLQIFTKLWGNLWAKTWVMCI